MNDLTNKQLGYLTVLKVSSSDKRGRAWLCKCVCGKEIILWECRLVGSPNRPPNKSCGCKKRTKNNITVRHKDLYHVWYNMVNRCTNPNDSNYHKYGAKGISVCEEWVNDFETFISWSLQNGYEKGLTLDRTDGNKGYSPYNCRWVTYYVQEQNKDISNRNTTGHVGVTFTEGRGYRSYISRNGKRKNLGSFNNLEDAIKARKIAEDYYIKNGTI